MVYQLIHQLGADQYYSLKKSATFIREARPVPTSPDSKYLALDELDIPKNQGVRFYIEGIHCSACLWLIEKLSEWVSDIHTIRLNIGTSIATVQLKPDGKISSVATALNRLGYRPHLIQEKDEENKIQQNIRQKELIRLGLVGVLTGNIMLLSFAMYTGANQEWGSYFKSLSLVLFIPVLTYGALPFYQSALASIYRFSKTKSISIDLPISFALIVGFLASLSQWKNPDVHPYFDSLATLVFLILSSRYILQRILDRHNQSKHYLKFYEPDTARRLNTNTNEYEPVPPQYLNTGDVIQVLRHETIPADGVLIDEEGIVNQSIITGESSPVTLHKGEEIFCGATLLSESVKLRTTKTSNETRIHQILSESEVLAHSKPKILSLFDRVAGYLVSAIVLISVLALGVFHWVGLPTQEAITRCLALIIITCPCALALGTPLTLSLSLIKAAKEGILFKTSSTIEKISQVTSILFDKTGTLTHGSFDILSYRTYPERGSIPEKEIQSVIYSMEKKSDHPIAQALVQYFEKHSPKITPIENLETLPEGGVAAEVMHSKWKIVPNHQFSSHSKTQSISTEIIVYKNDTAVAEILLGDKIRESSKQAIQSLKEKGLSIGILSGDSENAVTQVAKTLHIPVGRARAQHSPEQKSAYIKELSGSEKLMMVGDGMNDSAALSQSYVGVATPGGLKASLRHADIYLNQSGIHLVPRIFEISQHAFQTIKIGIGFSLLYNFIGTTAALMGWVSPLFAAVLMPLSALTIFLFSTMREGS